MSYLKVDMCSVDIGIDPASQLEHWGQLRDALNATGRAVYYSICPHSAVPRATGPGRWWWENGRNGTRPNTYSPPTVWTASERKGLTSSLLVEFTNLFDFWYAAEWAGPGSSPGGFLTNVDAMVELTRPEYSGPGSWADGDMLQVCNYGEGGVHAGGGHGSGMTLAEYAASLSIWAVLASPIIISADVRTVGQRHPECLAMLLGSGEVLAISQDRLGRPGRLVHQVANASVIDSTTIVEQIWARELEGGKVAVVLFNRAEKAREMTFSWTMWDRRLGLRRARDAWLRDVLSSVYNGTVRVSVEPHAVRVLILREAAEEVVWPSAG